jgi:hypothetical protein
VAIAVLPATRRGSSRHAAVDSSKPSFRLRSEAETANGFQEWHC